MTGLDGEDLSKKTMEINPESGIMSCSSMLMSTRTTSW